MRLICVAGARPNFMKIKPVVDALETRGVDVDLVHTGQHYDERMSDVFFQDLGIRPPDHSLGVGSGTHAEQTGRVMVAFEALLANVTADAIVVVGDVNSTLACAIVGAKAGPYVAHVESGLRSRDWSMPEEVNRVATDRISDFLLAPSPDAVDNLRAEGYPDERVHLVGNVMVDTLLANVDRARRRPILDDIGIEAGGYGLVTLHRPANVDDPEVLGQLMTALERVAERCPLVFPIHPRTRAQLPGGYRSGAIHLVEPAGYLDFIALEASARVVLTDSGGIQEETTVLGVPCLTLRDNTERPITIDEGTNTLVGRDPDRIVDVALDRIDHGAPRRCPELWDGCAGERIADVLISGCRDGVSRPTN